MSYLVGACSLLVIILFALFKFKHLLSALISLEYLFVILLFLGLMVNMFLSNQSLIFTLFLATAAAESAVALTSYVLVRRYYSKDYILNFFSSKV